MNDFVKTGEPSNSYFSKSAEKALRILSIFNEEHTRFTLGAISERIGLNITSTFRYVNTLLKLGYLTKNSQTKLIYLGPKSIALSKTLLKSYDLLNLVKPLVDDLHERHKVTVFFGIFYESVINLIYVRQDKETIGITYPSLNNLIHCTAMGKAALAYLPEDKALELVERTKLIKKTPHTITNKHDLIVEIKNIRVKGYSLNNEELVEGMISIGAATGYLDSNQSLGMVAFDFCSLFHSSEEIEKKYAGMILKLAKDVREIAPDHESYSFSKKVGIKKKPSVPKSQGIT